MLELIGLLALALPLIYFSPSKKLKAIFFFYFLALFTLLTGIKGFIFSDPSSKNTSPVYMAVYLVILLLHLPLLIKLSKMDHHSYKLASARRIFDKDVSHLTDEKLHSHLQHP